MKVIVIYKWGKCVPLKSKRNLSKETPVDSKGQILIHLMSP